MVKKKRIQSSISTFTWSQTFREFLKKNALLILLLFFYVVIMVSFLDFGIPNADHPFTYHMDEWHQLMAVKALFKHGSPNVEGAANGPVFFFFLSGLFLGPFYLLHFINPFLVTSSVDALWMQERIFEVLRLTSILFGSGCIVLVWFIAKKFLKSNPLLTTLLFVITPTWLMHSNYFKYDIALMFWILASLYCMFSYLTQKSKPAFYFAAIFIGCALATKISALPLLISYSYTILVGVKGIKEQTKKILIGFSTVALTFLLVGIPDVFSHAREYYAFFYLNIISGPKDVTSAYMLGQPLVAFMLFHIYPLLFGHALYYLFLLALVFMTFLLCKKSYRQKNKHFVLLYITFIFFSLSLVPLQILATGNRALVLSPFIAFIASIGVKQLFDKKEKLPLMFPFLIVVLVLTFQIGETYAWMQMKYGQNPRKEASVWLLKNSLHEKIGLENIPIYQGIPDINLKEFYTLQQNPKAATNFSYEVINAKTKQLPRIIVITNPDFDTYMLHDSPKKQLLSRLQKEKYKKIKQFALSSQLYEIFALPYQIQITGLLPLYPISIYKK